jgi:D-alanine--poly(phosphoribitol) ligase subunit 1
MQKLALEYLQKTQQKFPDKIALVDQNNSISFAELWRRSILFAGWLTENFGRYNQPIVIDISKSTEAIIALIAVQLTGNIYVPIDSDTPLKRKEAIQKSLNNALVIQLSSDNFLVNQKTFNIEDNSKTDNIESLEFRLFEALEQRTDLDPLYIIFTSGTTGVPKGVTISNRSVIDYIDWACRTYEISNSEIIGNQAPLYFDNSVLDLYLTLAQGCELHLIPDETLAFPSSLAEYLSQNEINFIFFVPSVLGNLSALDMLGEYDLTKIKKLLFAGEPMPLQTIKYFRKHLPNSTLSNLYGPTEITVDCIYWIFGDELEKLEHTPLGKPCDNTKILFIDEEEKPLFETDKIGEICVSGSGLSLGYWNQPEETRMAFIQNPVHENYSETIYKTGDLGYISSKDGLIYMIGRKDRQIKIRGRRVELGEIESAICRVEGIGQCAVLFDPNKQRITAFFSGEVTINKLTETLREYLPSYMIPVEFLKQENFPTTSNGKMDFKALQEKHFE